MLGREPGARVHETHVPRGDRERHPCVHERAPARAEFDVVAGAQVRPGVTGTCIGGGGQVRVQQMQGHGHRGRLAHFGHNAPL